MGVEIGIGTAMLVSGLIGGGTAAATAVAQNSASKRAAKAASKSNREALDFEKQRDEMDRAEAARIDALNREAHEVEQAREQQRYDTSVAESRRREAQDMRLLEQRRGRLKPYEDTGRAALDELGRLAGLSITPSAPPESMTGGWNAGNLTPPTDVAPFTPPPPKGMGNLGR